MILYFVYQLDFEPLMLHDKQLDMLMNRSNDTLLLSTLTKMFRFSIQKINNHSIFCLYPPMEGTHTENKNPWKNLYMTSMVFWPNLIKRQKNNLYKICTSVSARGHLSKCKHTFDTNR